MNLQTCPSCGVPHTENECPICSPMERIRQKAKAKRRDYAIQKSAEQSQNKKQTKP